MATQLTLLAGMASAYVQAAIPPETEHAFALYNELPALLVPVLESVTDKESADAAASRLNAVLPKVYDARSALQNISLTPETQMEIRQKYEQKMREDWGRVYSHIFRLQKNRCYLSLDFFKQFHALCLMLDQ